MSNQTSRGRLSLEPKERRESGEDNLVESGCLPVTVNLVRSHEYQARRPLFAFITVAQNIKNSVVLCNLSRGFIEKSLMQQSLEFSG